MPVALPAVELAVLVVALLCIALALLITNILKAVASHIPSPLGVFDWLKNGINAVAGSIASVLGKAEAGVDSAIGASLHALAFFMREWWALMKDYAGGYLSLAELVASLVYAHSGLRALVRRAEALVHGIEHGVKDLARKWNGIDARVRRLEHDIARGIGHDLRIGLAKTEAELANVERHVIPDLRAGIGAVEGEVEQLENFIGAIPGVKYAAWASALVLAGLAGLGLGGLKCNSLLSSLKNRGCGLWQGLEDLLGLLLDVAIFATFCDLWAVTTPIFQTILTPLTDFIATFATGACSHPPSSFASLSVTEGGIPPPQTLGSIAP